MAQIILKNIKKTYDPDVLKKPVLNQLSLSIEAGEFVGIVGPSGSGKTTLLYVMSGLEKVDSGEVLLFNKPLSTYLESDRAMLRRDLIGFVFQFFNLIPNLSIYDNLKLANVIIKNKGLTIEEALNLVGLKDVMHKYPSELSGGMQQRASIGRAILGEKKIIFADEPTGNLDYQTSLDIMGLFKELNQKLGITIVMVTHNEALLSYTNRVIRLLDGKIEKDEKR
ncbi:ABC transporter ATP-binding protein [Acholeplasma vituli]|uniref:ABC transporter ATP-binding protein n=1 Tax=Paracholeplasma vituli TaxID=69473 RepID=A0ABT2PUJ4_9MOLU|nr:ABC transporter ATP-binding protein [Paracholeplasma vituli]MCU0104619.1 ABC transporter ATP-binding protein [Paracholeplasma vituli]